MNINQATMNRITKDFIFDGFFSEYLPPSFMLSETVNFMSFALSEKNDLVDPYSFTMSRFTQDGKRRIIHIPEFSAYLKVIKFMVEKNLIKQLIEKSSDIHSFSPLINKNGELTRHENAYGFGVSLTDADQNAFISTYIPNVIDKINRARGSKGILQLDISNCYQSIYTHLLPCIDLGFDRTAQVYKLFKANQSDPTIPSSYHIYRDFDKILRGMNGDRTNGLLTGISVSRFVSEALLARIDEEIEKEGIRFVRYVDDYEIFIFNEKELQKTQSTVTNIFRKYYLSINNEKTKYTTFPYYVIENLEAIVTKHLSSSMSEQQIMDLFNSFFKFEENGTAGAIRFLVKAINNSIVKIDKPIFISYLYNILANDSRSLVKACELLISHRRSILTTQEDIERIERQIVYHINNENTLEAVWLLYLRLKLTKKYLKSEITNSITNSNNDLAKIVLLEEYKSRLTKKAKRQMIATANSWILYYQLYYNDYINKDTFSRKSGIKHNLAFYNRLKHDHFSFYVK